MMIHIAIHLHDMARDKRIHTGRMSGVISCIFQAMDGAFHFLYKTGHRKFIFPTHALCIHQLCCQSSSGRPCTKKASGSFSPNAKNRLISFKFRSAFQAFPASAFKRRALCPAIIHIIYVQNCVSKKPFKNVLYRQPRTTNMLYYISLRNISIKFFTTRFMIRSRTTRAHYMCIQKQQRNHGYILPSPAASDFPAFRYLHTESFPGRAWNQSGSEKQDMQSHPCQIPHR